MTVEFPHETNTELHCKYSECLFAKTFRELGAEDLGLIIGCEADHIFIQTMNPNLRLERSKTLMEGHDQCNHTFSWEE
ncbi:MAG: L-2-amino-thiazoline-4-carboxylic acid hydrolase [Candidatus Thorarchaeota archaeon]